LLALGSCGVAIVVSLSGCGRDSALCKNDLLKIEPLEGDIESVLSQAQAAWEKRADVAELLRAIELWEQAARIDTNRLDVFPHLARAFYFLGDGHYRFQDGKEEAMLQAFERGILYSELGLRAQSPEFRAMVCDGEDFEDAVKVVKADSVPLMYWYASNLGKWALAKGLMEALNQKNKIFAMMTRCAELDPKYFHGGPNRYFGSYYTKVPFPSGDEKLSRENFEKSIAIEPNYFATRVLMAELLATKLGDRKMFEESLRYVIDTDVAAIPDLVPEQEIEKRKAKLLLEDIDVLFEAEE
jgi:tetratricopeptide (TPR) repeat protein